MVTNVDLDLMVLEVEEELLDIRIQKRIKAYKYLHMIKVEVYIVTTFWNKD